MRALLWMSGVLVAGVAEADPVPVEVVKGEQGWRLLRGGEPYLVRGAGGSGPLDVLAAAGGNSIRTWGADDLEDRLDRAHELGLTVTVGIWLGHARHGFDWSDPADLEAQRARVEAAVRRYRDHPAVLMWGLGNEMEGFEEGDDDAVWTEVAALAERVKALDPHHPVMTVTAEIGGARVARVDAIDAIDIHGINAYGGAPSIPERYRAAGGDKPYVLTEFGPPGTWEIPKNPWGAVQEPTSTDKAAAYRATYEQAVLGAPGLSLGAYAFTWGHKMEATPTWFGLLLPDGATVGAVDVLSELWTGSPPQDLAPELAPLELVGGSRRQPGERLQVRAQARDPEGGPLEATWTLWRDPLEVPTGGDAQAGPTVAEGAIRKGRVDGARVRLPEAPGPYRLALTVRDAGGKAATANIPVLVQGEPRPLLPVTVFDESLEDGPWAPSGWMGQHEDLDLEVVDDAVHGEHALRLSYAGQGGWVGVAWQHPAEDWGEEPGGVDLTGARALELWARVDEGEAHVSLGVGLLGDDVAHPDSARVTREGIHLKDRWKRYRVPLRGEDLSQIKTGFSITLAGQSLPVTVRIDRVRFVE